MGPSSRDGVPTALLPGLPVEKVLTAQGGSPLATKNPLWNLAMHRFAELEGAAIVDVFMVSDTSTRMMGVKILLE